VLQVAFPVHGCRAILVIRVSLAETMSNPVNNNAADLQRQIDELEQEYVTLRRQATDLANSKEERSNFSALAVVVNKDLEAKKAERMLPGLHLTVSLIAHSCRLHCFFFAPLFGCFLIGVEVERAQRNAAGGSGAADMDVDETKTTGMLCRTCCFSY